jgi:uncharacterized protein
MNTFDDYLATLVDEQQRNKLSEILLWINTNYPTLVQRIAWNQPMYTDHGTFIIGFSTAKHHMSVAPERKTMDLFRVVIQEAGYETTQELFKIKWEQPVNYELLSKLIEFNVIDKATCKSFWRVA